jgi:hypothetical protein
VLATGIFRDERTVVERAVEYFKHGDGMGSVRHAIPVAHDDGLGEWVRPFPSDHLADQLKMAARWSPAR